MWYYCPKDPGCRAYKMSAKSTIVYANGYQVVKSEDLKLGDDIKVIVSGETTFTSVPTDGSYVIYDGEGKNLVAGPLAGGALTITGKEFVLTVEITLDAASTGSDFEFGIDIFYDKTGGDPEGMCIQIASPGRFNQEAGKTGFELDCKDNGDGSWTPGPSPIVAHPLPAPSCSAPKPPAPPSDCKLNWFYCPRDPGCKTYKMSVSTIEVDVQGSAIASGVQVTMIAKGTSSVTAISPSATYKVYDQDGKNMAQGVLDDVMTLDGTQFTVKVPMTLDASAVQGDLVEWGLDIFLGKGGSDEGMCVQVASDAYVKMVQPKVSPPFVTYCADEGNGNFVEKTIPDIVHDAMCVLEKV